nr:reverse transcriptase domain-containing protein [Tanacetum cinerariifolium]
MADRTVEELLQAPTEGYGEAIVIPEILAENFEIKEFASRMIATLKYRDVPNDTIKLMLFPYSLEDKARIWYEKEPPNSILTWEDLVNQVFPPSKTTHLKNEISHFTQRFDETFSEAWDCFKELLRACPHHGFSKLTQIDTFYNGLTEQDQDSLNAASGGNLDVVSKTDDRIDKLADQISNLVEIVNKQVIAPAKAVKKTCVTCGGAHAYYECIAIDSNPSSVCMATGSYNQVSPPNRASHQIPPPGFAPVQNNPNRFNQNQKPPSTSGTLPSNTIPNPKGKMKAVTTRSCLAYEGPSIPTESPLKKVGEQITEEILDKEHSNSSGSTAQVQPPVVPILIPEPDVSRTQTKPSNPYPSSFADALLLMPKLASTIKSLLANTDKLFELAKVPLNENCSAMLLKKLPEKLGDPELTPTRMTLELADRSITRPKGVTKDVFVKVGKFYFPTNFVVVDFEADPRVPLILGRVDVIDVTCEDLVQDVLDFQYNPKSSSPTLVSDDLIFKSDSSKVPILKSSSPTLTPFGESDFFLEEIEDFLNDDSIPTEESKEKSSVEEPPELELKELPSHLEYAFLEDSNKLPVIIAKNLKVDEREALINVLKSHKQAIAYKISDIKGIDPRLAGNEFYCFLDGISGYFQIPIDLQDQEKTTFTCPYGTFAYRRMPFGLCNAPGTFQMCMMSIFHYMIEKTMKVFMDDFSVFRDSFSSCLTNLDKMLTRYEETNLVLNWEKCHLMCREGIVLGHKISKSRIEVDRAKVDDFSKIARPMGHLLKKETPFVLSKECIDAFHTLKKKLTEASILVVPDWNLPFELMCDASDYAIGAVLGQRKSKHFQPVHYASKTMTGVVFLVY